MLLNIIQDTHHRIGTLFTLKFFKSLIVVLGKKAEMDWSISEGYVPLPSSSVHLYENNSQIM
jgi:hypothetical protein